MFKILAIGGLALYFVALICVVSLEKKSSDTLDFFFAGRKLPFWMLSIAFIASWWGAGSTLSTADLAFEDGLGAFWYYGVPVLLATALMMVGSGKIRRVGYLTQGQMLEARYSRSTAKLLSVMIFIFMVMNAATQMVGVGNFFGSYLGIPYAAAVLIGTGLVVMYSTIGGFRSVVLTDIIQFVCLLISTLIVCLASFHYAGGLEPIAQKAVELGKPDFMSFSAGIPKYMMYVVTFGCSWCIQANIWQLISATRNAKEARRMTTLSFFAYIPLYLLVVVAGMAGIVLYDKLPEGGIITAVVLNQMPPALGALVFIGITAAIMSTMDTLINSASLTLTMDLHKTSDSRTADLNFSRVATLIAAGLAILIALKIRSILELTWIASDVITTGVFVPLLGAFLWKRGNTHGANASMVWGLIFCFYNLALTLGLPIPALWDPHSTVKIIVGVGISLAVYVLVSLATPAEEDKSAAFLKLAEQD